MSFLTSAGKFVDLANKASVFEALAELSSEWPKLSQINDGRSLVDFLRASSGKFAALKPSDVPAGLRPALKFVQDNINELTGVIDDFEKSPASKLLSRLDRFSTPDVQGAADSGLIKWSGGGTLGSSPSKRGFGFELGAQASLSFDADDKWPFSKAEPADQDLSLLLSISASADLKAAATYSIKLPFSGVATGNVNASLQPVLQYYFAPDRQQLYGVALAKALGSLPAPTALGEVWRAAQRSDFKGLRLSVPGSFTAAFSVAVAAEAELGDVSLSAGLGISAKATRTSRLELSIRALPSATGIRPLQLRLANARSAQSQIGFDLDITLDATRLAARAARAVNAALDEVEKELGRLRRFTTPGTLIRATIETKVGELINDTSLRTALLRDFGLSDDTAGTGFVDWASAQVTDAIDAKASTVRDILQQNATSATDAVVAALQGKLGNALAGHEDTIRSAIDDLVDEVRNQLRGEIQKGITTATAPLGAALKRLGIDVQNGLATVDQWFAPVQRFLERIEKIVADVREKTELAAKAKLQVELTWEESRSQSSEFLLEAIITSDGPDVESLFDRLVEGDLDQVVALLGKPDGIKGFQLNREKSWLALKSSWEDKTSLRLSILGLELGSTLTLSAGTLVSLDGNGNLTLTTKAIASSETNGIKIAQKAAVLAAFQAIAQVGKPAQVASPQLHVRISRNYKDLTVGALEAFLQGLEKRGLIGQGLPRQARSKLAELAAPGGQQKLPASLQLTSNVAPLAAWRAENWGWRLLVPDQAEAAEIELYALVLAAARATGFLSNNQIGWAAGIARNRSGLAYKLPDNPTDLDLAKLFRAYARIETGITDILSDVGANAITAHQEACLLFGGTPVEGVDDFKTKPRGLPGLVRALRAIYTLGRISRDENRPDLLLLRKQLQSTAEQLADGMAYWFSGFVLLPDWSNLAGRLELMLVVLASILDGDVPKPEAPMSRPFLALTLDPADEFVDPSKAKPIVLV